MSPIIYPARSKTNFNLPKKIKNSLYCGIVRRIINTNAETNATIVIAVLLCSCVNDGAPGKLEFFEYIKSIETPISMIMTAKKVPYMRGVFNFA